MERARVFFNCICARPRPTLATVGTIDIWCQQYFRLYRFNPSLCPQINFLLFFCKFVVGLDPLPLLHGRHMCKTFLSRPPDGNKATPEPAPSPSPPRPHSSTPRRLLPSWDFGHTSNSGCWTWYGGFGLICSYFIPFQVAKWWSNIWTHCSSRSRVSILSWRILCVTGSSCGHGRRPRLCVPLRAGQGRAGGFLIRPPNRRKRRSRYNPNLQKTVKILCKQRVWGVQKDLKSCERPIWLLTDADVDRDSRCWLRRRRRRRNDRRTMLGATRDVHSLYSLRDSL